MADRTYLYLLACGEGDLKRVALKPDANPETGIVAADLREAEKRALQAVRRLLVQEVGLAQAVALIAKWVASGTAYPGAVPGEIRELAEKLGSAVVWQRKERYDGREKRVNASGREFVAPLTSRALLQEAGEVWDSIRAAGVVFYDAGTYEDLAAASGDYGVGVASPAGDTTFFPAADTTEVHGTKPAFSAERVFKALEGDWEGV